MTSVERADNPLAGPARSRTVDRMEILRKEVTAAAATDVESPVHSAPARPEVDNIVVHADTNVLSAIDSVHTQKFLNGTLPVGVTVRVPYPLAPLSLAPDGLQVTHQFSGPHRRFVRLEDGEVAEVLITET